MSSSGRFQCLPLVDANFPACMPFIFTFFHPLIIFFQIQETNTLLRSVLEVQPRMSSGGTGKTSDEIVFELADSILGKLPDLLDMETASKELFKVRFCH